MVDNYIWANEIWMDEVVWVRELTRRDKRGAPFQIWWRQLAAPPSSPLPLPPCTDSISHVHPPSHLHRPIHSTIHPLRSLVGPSGIYNGPIR